MYLKIWPCLFFHQELPETGEFDRFGFHIKISLKNETTFLGTQFRFLKFCYNYHTHYTEYYVYLCL